MQNQPTHCLIVGYGYVAHHLAAAVREIGWACSGTYRNSHTHDQMVVDGVTPVRFEEDAIQRALQTATHLVISVPPGEGSEQARQWLAAASAPHLVWVGYLSSTAVYGDHAGAWVNEETILNPLDDRGAGRLRAEQAWQAVAAQFQAACFVFRLAGIYGAGRSALDQLRAGTARSIVKAEHVFSRIHVADIVRTVMAAMQQPENAGIYNVADDCPAPSHDVMAYAAMLLGMDPPVPVPYEQATLSPMLASFYAANRRITNDRMKQALGIHLAYADYRCGLKALAESVDVL